MLKIPYRNKRTNPSLMDEQLREACGGFFLGLRQDSSGLLVYLDDATPVEIIEAADTAVSNHDPRMKSRTEQRDDQLVEVRNRLLTYDFSQHQGEVPEWVIDTFEALQDVLRG